jgi:uncharacterized protein YifN (PemK superfamily)
MNITVDFIHFKTGIPLGLVQRDNILEVLVPAFQANTHNVFMSKRFHAHPNVVQWKVEYVYHDNGTTYVFLNPIQDQPLSFAQYAKTQSKKESFYLRPFQIVDVDFGFPSNIYDSTGDKGKNQHYSSTLLPGELYKRRPCIVLSKDGPVAQVIPLTTKNGSNTDPKRVPISKKSFDSLSSRYRQKNSFALVHLIQTVSASRIFPPKLINGSYSRNYAGHEITKDDKASIELALAKLHSNKVITNREILENQLARETEQKLKLLDANQRLKDDILQKDMEKNTLENHIKSIGAYLELGEDIEDIIGHFK